MWRAITCAALCLTPLAAVTRATPDSTRPWAQDNQRVVKKDLKKLALCFGYGLHAYGRAVGPEVESQAGQEGYHLNASGTYAVGPVVIEVQLGDGTDIVLVKFPKGTQGSWTAALASIGARVEKSKPFPMVGGSTRIIDPNDPRFIYEWIPSGADIEPDNPRADNIDEVQVNKEPMDILKVYMSSGKAGG